jgi:hypothetical protein
LSIRPLFLSVPLDELSLSFRDSVRVIPEALYRNEGNIGHGVRPYLR